MECLKREDKQGHDYRCLLGTNASVIDRKSEQTRWPLFSLSGRASSELEVTSFQPKLPDRDFYSSFEWDRYEGRPARPPASYSSVSVLFLSLIKPTHIWSFCVTCCSWHFLISFSHCFSLSVLTQSQRGQRQFTQLGNQTSVRTHTTHSSSAQLGSMQTKSLSPSFSLSQSLKQWHTKQDEHNSKCSVNK